MGTPYTQEDVDQLYMLIGKAVWHLQHLENIVAFFTAFKILQVKRAKGEKLSTANAAKLIEKQKKLTLGPLISTAKSHKTISPPLARRFDELLVERNWLIHKCVTDEYLSLRNQLEKQRLFARIDAFSEEAIALQNGTHSLFEQWFIDLGYDLGKAYEHAEHQLKQAEQG
jgi:uncharacterized FlgJ-related protein